MAAIVEQHPELEVHTSEDVRPRAWKRLKELYQHREILMNLIRKEIKVKYTSSVLGAAWSMLNPLLYLAVFTLVFDVVLSNHTQHLLNLALLTWFWFTPIIYQSGLMQQKLERHGMWLWLTYLANPMGDIVFGFQRALYGQISYVDPVTHQHVRQLVRASVGFEA